MLLIGIVLHVDGNFIIDKKPVCLISRNTLFVGGDGPSKYSKIQDAINDSVDGDTVFVYDDSSPYFENIVVDKSINIIGENKETTVIDGNNKIDVLYLSADWVYISGFTIQNSGVYPDYYAGIYINSNSNTITDNNISSNNGEGIKLYNSNSNIISGNIMSNNKENGIYLEVSNNNYITNNIFASGNDRGLLLKDSDSNTINDNIISENDLGMSLLYSGGNTIIGNSITNNPFSGLLLWGYENVVTSNNISGNAYFGGIGGGIWVLNARKNTIAGNTISSNTHYGLYINSESSDNIIISNTVSNNYDGIILNYFSHRNTIKGNTISNNYYGINLSTSFNNIFNNNFLNNEQHSFFDTAFSNKWLRNYWEGDNSIPVRINGTQSFYLKDRQDNIIWETHIPWVNFDWLPAKEPYEL